MPVDLAILDLHLPDGDGSELGLRLVQSNPSIQLIVLTSRFRMNCADQSMP